MREVLADVDVKSLWVGAAAALGSYVAVYAIGLLLLLVAVLGVSTMDSARAVSNGPLSLTGTDLADAWSMLGQFGAQLVAMAHFGELSAEITGAVPFFGTVDGGLSVRSVPLSLLALSLYSVYTAGWIAERRLPSLSRAQLVAQSMATGIAYSAVVNIVAAAAAVRFPGMEGATISPVTAAGFWPTLIAFIVGLGLSMAARTRASGGAYGRILPESWSGLVDLARAVVGSHLLVFTAVAVPAIVVAFVIAQGWAGLLVAPLVILNAVGVALVVGHLGGIQMSFVNRFPGPRTSQTSGEGVFYGLEGDDRTAMVLAVILLAMICTLISGTVLVLRRGRQASPSISGWFGIPCAYLAAGLLLLPALTTSASFHVGGLAEGQGAWAPAWWFPAVFLVWGGLVELAARFVAPYILPFVPPRLSHLARSGAPGQVARARGAGEVDPKEAPLSVASGGPVYVEAQAKKLTPEGRKRAALVAAAVGLVVVLGIGGTVAVNVVKAGNGPYQVVTTYLQALVDGDAEKAVDISSPDVPKDDRLLLTNDVYQAAGKRIDGFSIVKSEISGESAVVRAELRQNGRRVEVPFTLNKGRKQLLDDDWKLKPAEMKTIRFTADAAVDAFAVNGVTVDNPQPKSSLGAIFVLPAFPGEYTVGIAAADKFVTADEERILVSIGLDSPVRDTRLKVKATKELEGEVARQLEGAWAACASSDKLMPKDCPFVQYDFGEIRGVKWSVKDKPKYELRQSYDGGWRIVTSAEGVAEVSYERNASFNRGNPDWKPVKDSVSFRAAGQVKADNGKIVVSMSRY